MARFKCWMNGRIIVKANTLDELKRNLKHQVDDNNIDMVECYDYQGQDIDVYELLGIDIDRIIDGMIREIRDKIRLKGVRRV